MSEKQTNNTWRRDGLGLVLFAVFAFLGVLVIMAWAQPPRDPAEGRSGLVMGLIGFLGELPILLGCLGLVWLGFRLFLGEVPDKLGQLGITLVALVLGLSIVLGAAWQDHGGSMGQAASGLLSPVLAALFGLVVVGFPLWRLWIGPVLALNSATEADPVRVLDTDTRDGLSVAEAEALLPEEIPEPIPVPSPYPPDVRREGLIPKGARPIIPDDGRTTTQDPFDALPVPGTPEGESQAEQPADSHMAAGGSPAPVESVGSGTPEPLRGQAAGEPTLESPPPAASPQPLESETRVAGPTAVPEALESAAIPSPSWEQPELFVEEPVDAYGTPDSLVETLRETDPTAEIPTAEVKPGPETEVVEEQVEVAAEQDDEQEPEQEEAEEEEDAEEGEYEEEGDEEEGDEEEEEDDEEDEEGEYEEEEEEEEDEEEEDAEYAEEDDEGEEDDEDEEEEEEDEEEEEEAEETEAQPVAAVEPEVEIVPQRAPQAPAESAPRSEAAPAVSQSGSEEDLVFKAGTLILERERVAVSLLQREFHLDFDQATHVLDRLQESGLIGPYVGGQRRDILLTAEEWQEKRVGSS